MLFTEDVRSGPPSCVCVSVPSAIYHQSLFTSSQTLYKSYFFYLFRAFTTSSSVSQTSLFIPPIYSGLLNCLNQVYAATEMGVLYWSVSCCVPPLSAFRDLNTTRTTLLPLSLQGDVVVYDALQKLSGAVIYRRSTCQGP